MRHQILSAIKIASRCGQAISIQEIDLMLPNPRQVKSIEDFIQNDSFISKSVSLEKKFVVLKGYENLFSERQHREIVSKRYLEVARAFVNQLIKQSSNWKLIAVSGSVAYKSANASDDIDIFLITKKDRMWLCFIKALILARIFNIKASLNRKKINFCLSYVQDEGCFMKEILNHRTYLLARELLSIRVLAGIEYYRFILNETSWIGDLFPKLYASRPFKKSNYEKKEFAKESPSITSHMLDLLVFSLLKRYLSLKAFLRNLAYRKQNRRKDVFEARISKCSCVYTSKKYRELEKMYESMQVLRK